MRIWGPPRNTTKLYSANATHPLSTARPGLFPDGVRRVRNLAAPVILELVLVLANQQRSYFHKLLPVSLSDFHDRRKGTAWPNVIERRTPRGEGLLERCELGEAVQNK